MNNQKGFNLLPQTEEPERDIGVIIGKFMPLHKGHELLINFGKKHVKQLFILVDNTINDTIDSKLREKIIQKHFPDVKVLSFNEKMPQDPSETNDFWNIWKTEMEKLVFKNTINNKIDVLFASMDYGEKLSETLGCEFVPFDISRSTLNISATEIRNDPLGNWKYISDCFKPYFVNKYLFTGAESTGKTTLINRLINETDLFKESLSLFVPEYAYQFIKTKKELKSSDIPLLFSAQDTLINEASKTSEGVLLCDSSAITTKAYAQQMFPQEYEEIPSYLQEYVNKQKFEMVFLFKPDKNVAFFEDVHRNKTDDYENKRMEIFLKIKSELDLLNQSYLIIEGTYEERFQQIKMFFASISN